MNLRRITMSDYNSITENDLQEGAKLFEIFWLRPKKYTDKIVPLRLRINKKWGGWKIKDELISSLGLEVGDTISTEVTPCFMSGIIEDENDTDLFASASGADWLLNNNIGVGTIIDCFVRFVYSKSPIGLNGKDIYKVSLVFERGISVVGVDQEYVDNLKDSSENINDFFRNFLK